MTHTEIISKLKTLPNIFDICIVDEQGKIKKLSEISIVDYDNQQIIFHTIETNKNINEK